MKRPFGNLYDDFFGTEKVKPKDNQQKTDTNKPSYKQLMDDLDTLEDSMNHLIAKTQKEIDQGIAQLEKNDDTATIVSYQDVNELVKKQVYGQDEAIAAFNQSLKQPFYKDQHARCLNTILLCGPQSSGKHTLVDTFAKALYVQGILSSSSYATIDLSQIVDEKTLIQDLYSALYQPRTFVVFDHLEACPPTYLALLTPLLKNGTLSLKERYKLQNKQLISTKETLQEGLVKEIVMKEQYLIFIADSSLEKTKERLGQLFLENIREIITTNPLSEKTILLLLKKDFAKFSNQVETHFHTTIHFDKAAIQYFLRQAKQNSYDVIKNLLDRLYQELSNLLFQKSQDQLTLTCINNKLTLDGTHFFLAEDDKTQVIEAIQKEMDEIVGLENVKKYIYSLKDMVTMKKRREAQGLKSTNITMHMIFTGNPGTGKTTMARLIARYLKALGVLKNGQLVEVTRADLVAQYVGQTAPKTKQVIQASLGGVLFIDEAYALYRGKEDNFGLEAIDTLVKEMEDHRDDLVIVLAGYTKEMDDFLKANSGLKSRFPNTLEFPDYTPSQLVDIACNIAQGKDYTISEAAKAKLLTYLNAHKQQNSGNGRLARNIVEEAILNQASRLMNETDAHLTQLEAEDFILAED